MAICIMFNICFIICLLYTCILYVDMQEQFINVFPFSITRHIVSYYYLNVIFSWMCRVIALVLPFPFSIVLNISVYSYCLCPYRVLWRIKENYLKKHKVSVIWRLNLIQKEIQLEIMSKKLVREVLQSLVTNVWMESGS